MFGGKTTELLRRILWARNGRHQDVLVVKPAYDDRYSTTRIVSHDGLSSAAESITSWFEVAEVASRATVVCIDEAQFFTAPNFDGDIVEIVLALLRAGKEVVVAGLDMDWQGRAFPVMAAFLAMADEVVKRAAYCTTCGRPAGKTYKKDKATDTCLGAGELYEARCNDHWD